MIKFLPDNKTIETKDQMTILEAAVAAGVSIDGNCSGKGTCGKCKVKILQGDLSYCKDPNGKLTDAEKIGNVRLACCHQVSDGMVVEVQDATSTADRKRNMFRLPEGFEVSFPVVKTHLILDETYLKESVSDEERIKTAAKNSALGFDIGILRKLPSVLSENRDITITVLRNRVIDIEEGNTVSKNYGMAVDIGTTTVVVMIWDINNGELVNIKAFTNPQGAYGADVISRINYISEDMRNLNQLNSLIIDGINDALSEVELAANISRDNIYIATVVGNTTMSCIFAGVNPYQMAVSPFSPVYRTGVSARAERFGIRVSENAELYIGPNIAGHVGSDITAGIITTDLMNKDKGHLFIDIGTNGELVMTGNGQALACSTAAGPAFEGSSISQGMRAAEGAVEKVEITDDVYVSVIGSGVPLGICGSGIIDAVGELVRTGIIDETGRIQGPAELKEAGLSESIRKHIKRNDRVFDFVLYFGESSNDDIVITQKDIREVQLAKAAISAGIEIMMRILGLNIDSLNKISIAGAFGNYIRVRSAITIGLLPDISEDKIFSLGNAAGIGASMMLLSQKVLEQSELVASEVKHVQLATEFDFEEKYLDGMSF